MWTWPELIQLRSSLTLKDQLTGSIEIKIEDNAKIYASSAEDLAKFTRDAKIAEATYTVLIEQVKFKLWLLTNQKLQCLNTLRPHMVLHPRRNLILGLSAVVGIIVGCGLALTNAIRRGVCYNDQPYLLTQMPIPLKSRPIRRISKRTISEITAQLSKRKITAR